MKTLLILFTLLSAHAAPKQTCEEWKSQATQSLAAKDQQVEEVWKQLHSILPKSFHDQLKDQRNPSTSSNIDQLIKVAQMRNQGPLGLALVGESKAAIDKVIDEAKKSGFQVEIRDEIISIRYLVRKDEQLRGSVTRTRDFFVQNGRLNSRALLRVEADGQITTVRDGLYFAIQNPSCADAFETGSPQQALITNSSIRNYLAH